MKHAEEKVAEIVDILVREGKEPSLLAIQQRLIESDTQLSGADLTDEAA